MAWSHTKNDYVLHTDISAFDFKAIHAYLSGDAYWSKGIPFDVVERAFQNSLSFGLFAPDGAQIGAARMITDKATFAYMADVYILDDHRGQGLGVWMIEKIMEHPDLQGLRRYMLATSNMHDLYKKVGFKSLSNPPIMMEIVHPDMYGDPNVYRGEGK